MESCMHRIPEGKAARGKAWPLGEPRALGVPPQWLSEMEKNKKGLAATEELEKEHCSLGPRGEVVPHQERGGH